MKLINDENTLSHIVKKDSKLFTYLKDELVLSLRQTNFFLLEGNLLVNNKQVTKNINLKKDDIIQLKFPDETNDYEREDIPFEIIYESVDLLIINKPPRLIVHPTKNIINHTLANAVAYYFNKINLKRKIRFVNRLDMDTSGIIIVAKNPYSQQFLQKQFEDEEFSKKYLTIIAGHLSNKSGIITEKIIKDEESNKYITDVVGKESVTLYKVIKEYSEYSLVECEIKTGRTHQIRVHLASLGSHILSDSFYHKESPLISRMALHAYSMTLIEPRTNEQKTFVCELPYDMKKLL